MRQEPSSRERVLALLEENRGQFVSGETIAQQLQISRNAVWKAITALRGSGYEIRAVTRRGYCLAEENDILSLQGIARHLTDDTDADRIRIFRELPSTSRTAKELAVAGAPHGTVIIAGRQTAGAGRRAGRFFSPSGGLYMSVVIWPEADALPAPGRYTMLAAVAACMALETLCGVYPEIREVDDLYLDGRKICGILTESGAEVESGVLQWLVLGIGIHYNISRESFPEELRAAAGTVYDGTPAATRNQLAAEILNRILHSGMTPDELTEAYRARHFAGTGDVNIQNMR